MTNSMIGDVPSGILGMLADLCLKLKNGNRTPEQLECFLKGKNPFASANELVREWQAIYKEVFGIECGFVDLNVPKKRKGFNHLIVVAKGMTPNCVYDAIKKLMPAWKYSNNLDSIVSERKADRDYAVWVRDRVEADEELKNKSANDLKQENVIGITLEERLLYELKFFRETGKHLDEKNITLCSGSRLPDGGVPYVYWDDGEVSVYWFDPSRCFGYLRSRAVVS